MTPPAGNVADNVARWAAETPWAPALIDSRQVVHWRALDRAVDHAALWLARQGLAPGQRVGIALPPRSALYIVVVYALARLGAPAMLLALQDSAARRAELARRFGLVAVIGHNETAGVPAAAASGTQDASNLQLQAGLPGRLVRLPAQPLGPGGADDSVVGVGPMAVAMS